MMSFKEWIVSHDPKNKWDFNDPQELKEQLINVISESGDINLDTIFHVMYLHNDTRLTVKQNKRFLTEVLVKQKVIKKKGT